MFALPSMYSPMILISPDLASILVRSKNDGDTYRFTEFHAPRSQPPQQVQPVQQQPGWCPSPYSSLQQSNGMFPQSSFQQSNATTQQDMAQTAQPAHFSKASVSSRGDLGYRTRKLMHVTTANSLWNLAVLNNTGVHFYNGKSLSASNTPTKSIAKPTNPTNLDLVTFDLAEDGTIFASSKGDHYTGIHSSSLSSDSWDEFFCAQDGSVALCIKILRSQNQLATGFAKPDRQGSVIVQDLCSARPLLQLPLDASPLNLEIDPQQGRMLVHMPGKFWLFDLRCTQKPVAIFSGIEAEVASSTKYPTCWPVLPGNLLVHCGGDRAGCVSVWDSRQLGKRLLSWKEPESCAVWMQQNVVAAALADGRVHLYDIGTCPNPASPGATVDAGGWYRSPLTLLFPDLSCAVVTSQDTTPAFSVSLEARVGASQQFCMGTRAGMNMSVPPQQPQQPQRQYCGNGVGLSMSVIAPGYPGMSPMPYPGMPPPPPYSGVVAPSLFVSLPPPLLPTMPPPPYPGIRAMPLAYGYVPHPYAQPPPFAWAPANMCYPFFSPF
eukprot:TRINITY_DN1675_c0_g1_i1.p1 TRINITY_DN1675_c0_g1~~TRINITY_DN1675_c0_g1_i1.p1  ORF type:complete len:548 (-),score=93.69 TRINITY_DN1675_c0_g1_i1:27-1670(-)